MTTTNLGRIAIVPKGTWAAGSYKALDLVRYNGASYVAKSATTASPTDTTYWQLVNSDGATGAAGPTGATGPAGTNGTNGVDGTTLYTWIKYADDAVGTGLSDSPIGKSYIGIAVNKSSATESTTASDYSWSLIKGADGSGTLSSITAGTGLSGGTITTTGTIALADTSVTPGSYTTVNITVDAQGRITAVANGATSDINTFLNTPSSANLLAAVTDETGIGSLVFNTTPIFIGLRETKTTMAANNIDLAIANYFSKTITGATTLTVSNVPSSGTTGSFILDLTNGGAGTITWWANLKWVGGIAPVLTAAGRDTLGFFTYDGGTTWTGLTLGKDIK